MKRRLAALALVGVLSSALAGDAPAPPSRSVLHAPDPWKPKETTTETIKRRETVTVGGAKPVVTTLDCQIVRRCDEVDERGRWMKGEIHFARWSRVVGGKTDATVQATTYLVPRGKEWRIVSSPGAPNTWEGVEWLKAFFAGPDAFGEEDASAEADDEPAAELVVGAPVEARAAATERRLAAAGLPFPASGIVAKFTLTDAKPCPAPRGVRVAYERACEFASEGKGKADGKDVEYLPGTTTRETVSITKLLGFGRSTTTRTLDLLRVVVVAGATERARTETHVEETMQRRPGGEIPAHRWAGGEGDK